MISGECFTSEWQTRKREELGGCDPVLLEKTIHAFALLDALATRGLEFVFKGGTSLLLRASADCPLTWTFSAMSRRKNSTDCWLKSAGRRLSPA
jgi:hypothetical protein